MLSTAYPKKKTTGDVDKAPVVGIDSKPDLISAKDILSGIKSKDEIYIKGKLLQDPSFEKQRSAMSGKDEKQAEEIESLMEEWLKAAGPFLKRLLTSKLVDKQWLTSHLAVNLDEAERQIREHGRKKNVEIRKCKDFPQFVSSTAVLEDLVKDMIQETAVPAKALQLHLQTMFMQIQWLKDVLEAETSSGFQMLLNMFALRGENREEIEEVLTNTANLASLSQWARTLNSDHLKKVVEMLYPSGTLDLQFLPPGHGFASRTSLATTVADRAQIWQTLSMVLEEFQESCQSFSSLAAIKITTAQLEIMRAQKAAFGIVEQQKFNKYSCCAPVACFVMGDKWNPPEELTRFRNEASSCLADATGHVDKLSSKLQPLLTQ